MHLIRQIKGLVLYSNSYYVPLIENTTRADSDGGKDGSNKQGSARRY